MKALIAIAVAVAIIFFGTFLIRDNDQLKEVPAVVPANNASNDDRSECLPIDLVTIQFANVPELKAPQWKLYPENPETQQYMGADGHMPIKNFDALDASIDYQMWGPSVSCVSGAGIYASYYAPAPLAATRAKFLATVKRWFINTKLSFPSPLQKAIASDEAYTGQVDEVAISFSFERNSGAKIQPNGAKYFGGEWHIEFTRGRGVSK